MTASRIAAFIFGGFVGAWIARALFQWLLDVPGTVFVVLLVVFTVSGALLGLAARVEDERERRSARRS